MTIAPNTRNTLSLSLIASFAFALAGCTGHVDDEPATATADDSLIGGNIAHPGQLDATVFLGFLDGACTGTRVGPRHVLTAAHCVTTSWSDSTGLHFNSGALSPAASGGTTLRISNDKIISKFNIGVGGVGPRWTIATIANTIVDPGWVTECNFTPCTNEHIHSGSIVPNPADVALIVLTEDLPSYIPSAKIDMQYVPPGSDVMIAGYGCESVPEPRRMS